MFTLMPRSPSPLQLVRERIKQFFLKLVTLVYEEAGESRHLITKRPQ